MPAFLDYDPNFEEPPASQPDLESKPALVWYHGPKGPYETQPGPLDLVYGTPKDYSWKEYKRQGKLSYALVPNGYGVDEKRELVKFDKCGQPECASASSTCEGGTCKSGRCVPNSCPECEKGQCPDDKSRLLYADDIILGEWPAYSDYFYVELRRNDEINNERHVPNVFVFNKTAKDACFPSAQDDDSPATKTDVTGTGNLVCGYIKIGNLLQIMQRIADTAKACEQAKIKAKSSNDPELARVPCDASYFGISSIVDKPLWADRWTSIGSGLFIYEPAHNPYSHDYFESQRGERDRDAFADLYKLYQMSLVNTSQLIPSVPPVTISK